MAVMDEETIVWWLKNGGEILIVDPLYFGEIPANAFALRSVAQVIERIHNLRVLHGEGGPEWFSGALIARALGYDRGAHARYGRTLLDRLEAHRVLRRAGEAEPRRFSGTRLYVPGTPSIEEALAEWTEESAETNQEEDA